MIEIKRLAERPTQAAYGNLVEQNVEEETMDNRSLCFKDYDHDNADHLDILELHNQTKRLCGQAFNSCGQVLYRDPLRRREMQTTGEKEITRVLGLNYTPT